MIFVPIVKSISRKSCKGAGTAIIFMKGQYTFGQKLENPEENEKS